MILDNCSYISAIEESVNDNTKFSKLDIPTGKEIDLISEQKLLKHKEFINKYTCKSIKPVGSGPGISYRLGKILKETLNGPPTFCPIHLAIGTPTYKLAKLSLQFLKVLRQLMNILSLIPFTWWKKFVASTLTYT